MKRRATLPCPRQKRCFEGFICSPAATGTAASCSRPQSPWAVAPAADKQDIRAWRTHWRQARASRPNERISPASLDARWTTVCRSCVHLRLKRRPRRCSNADPPQVREPQFQPALVDRSTGMKPIQPVTIHGRTTADNFSSNGAHTACITRALEHGLNVC